MFKVRLDVQGEACCLRWGLMFKVRFAVEGEARYSGLENLYIYLFFVL